MKGGRRSGGKINTSSSAVMKKEITLYHKGYYQRIKKGPNQCISGNSTILNVILARLLYYGTVGLLPSSLLNVKSICEVKLLFVWILATSQPPFVKIK